MRPGIYLALGIVLFYGCFGSKAPQGQTNMPRKATYFNNNGLTLVASTFGDSESVNNGEKSLQYFFKISIVTNEIVGFDSVWIGQKPLHLFIVKEKNPVTSGQLKVPLGSTITLRASDFTSLQIPDNSKSPVPYEGVGLIRYLLSGKPYYLVVKEIKPIARPKKP